MWWELGLDVQVGVKLWAKVRGGRPVERTVWLERPGQKSQDQACASSSLPGASGHDATSSRKSCHSLQSSPLDCMWLRRDQPVPSQSPGVLRPGVCPPRRLQGCEAQGLTPSWATIAPAPVPRPLAWPWAPPLTAVPLLALGTWDVITLPRP